MSTAAKGAWSLKEALARREQYEQEQEAKRKQPKRAPKVIEIRDEEEASYKTKRTKKATSTNQKVADIINKATSQKVVEVNKNTVTEQFNSETANTSVKAKKLTVSKKRLSTAEEDGDSQEEFGSPRSRSLPRECPSRKSPRIRGKAIVLESSDDSEPELLPVNGSMRRQPLRTTENNNTNTIGGKRRKIENSKAVKQNPAPQKPAARAPATRAPAARASRQITRAGSSPVITTRTSSNEAVTKAAIKIVKPPANRASPNENRLLSPPVRNKRSRKTPGAPAAPAPPALADVIPIPDDLRGSRKKAPMESKVVKKKAVSAPVESKVVKKKAPSKKNQGPAKAGSTPPLPISTVVANTTQKTSYTLDKVLGSGGFGYIYIVTCGGDKQRAVMKVEPQDNGPLFSEMHFYQRAGKREQLDSWTKKMKLKYLGIPDMLGFGIHLHGKVKYRYLVMPLFEGDLLNKHKEEGERFAINTTILLCLRMLEALQYIHEAGYVHADVKSANILLKNSSKQVYLADFGLARKYQLDGAHKMYREEPAKAHDGTKEFTSIDAHRGVQPSRRGDLQILAYCAIDWIGGKLPWYTWANCNNIRTEKIKYEKRSGELLESCLGLANLTSKPWKALKSFLNSSFSLDYEEEPDYKLLIKILQAGLSKQDTGFVTWV